MQGWRGRNDAAELRLWLFMRLAATRASASTQEGGATPHLDVLAGALGVDEDAGALDDQVDAHLLPRQRQRVAARHDLPDENSRVGYTKPNCQNGLCKNMCPLNIDLKASELSGACEVKLERRKRIRASGRQGASAPEEKRHVMNWAQRMTGDRDASPHQTSKSGEFCAPRCSCHPRTGSCRRPPTRCRRRGPASSRTSAGATPVRSQRFGGVLMGCAQQKSDTAKGLLATVPRREHLWADSEQSQGRASRSLCSRGVRIDATLQEGMLFQHWGLLHLACRSGSCRWQHPAQTSLHSENWKYLLACLVDMYAYNSLGPSSSAMQGCRAPA